MTTNNPFEDLASRLNEIAQKQDEVSTKLDRILKSETSDNELITRLEKAKQLRVSLPTLRNWEDQGLISPVRIGRRVYFRKGTDHPKSNTILQQG